MTSSGQPVSKTIKQAIAKWSQLWSCSVIPKPAAFAVRSGARVSMPGMMDTVLNLGLNDTTINGLIEGSVMSGLPMIAIVALSKCMAM